MTIEQFWAFYDEQETFDRTTLLALKEFFLSNTIETCPEIEEYEMDLEDVLFQGFERNFFEESMEVASLLYEKFNNLYMSNFVYYDKFFIEYFCFNNKQEKVIEHFRNYDANPTQNYEYFINTINLLILYNFNDLVCNCCVKNYDKFKKVEGFNVDTIKPINDFIFLNTINEYIKNSNGVFDRNELTKKIDELNFDYEFSDYYLTAIEKAIFNKFPEKSFMLEIFNSDKSQFEELIKVGFSSYMLNKGVSYHISQNMITAIFYIMFGNSNIRENTPFLKYFAIDRKRIIKYLNSQQSNFLVEDRNYDSLILWGSVYFYDFLKENALVPNFVYSESLKIVKELKEQFLFSELINLWKYSFIHNWEKPNSISDDFIENEKKLFKISLKCHSIDLHDMKSFIENEIGAESDYYLPLKQQLIKANKEFAKAQKKMLKFL